MDDEIVRQVLTRLKKRRQQKIDFFYRSDQAAPKALIYYHYANVTVQNVTIALIRDLYRLDTRNAWVKWLLTGLDYQVNLTLVLSFKQFDFVPLPLLTTWPITFKDRQQRSIIAFEKLQITRQDLVLLPPESIILKTHAQKITMLGRDEIVRRRLILQERSNRTCIWEK